MNEEKKMLQVGDVVYSFNNFSCSYKYKIDRVTKTMAISGNMRFRRQYDSWIDPVDRSGYSTIMCQIETPELKEKYTRGRMIIRLNNIKWDEVSQDKAKQICKILFPPKKENE